jgi:pimeloyl-ACP methyl ester carboxylesterase
MIRKDVQIDITGCGATDGPLHIAATVYLPDSATLAPPAVMFAGPGAGYGRGYYDMAPPDFTGYSQAEHHVARGFIFVAYDHLGVGDSSTTGLDTLTFEVIAAANNAAIKEALRRISDGTLVTGYPPVKPKFVIGIGQSMGGGVSIIMQARHRTFDALAVLGCSTFRPVLPQPSGKPPIPIAPRSENIERTDLTYLFHWEDEPSALVEADMAGGYPVRRAAPPWGSLTVPPCVRDMVRLDYLKAEAASIDVPVLLAFGERDVAENSHLELSRFTASRDVSLFIVPAMAHMHNFASTRKLLWNRIDHWAGRVAAR